VLVAMSCGRAVAHPHSGGIVVTADGTVVVGDILGTRLLVIEPSGSWREIPDIGHVRGLARAADGTIYGTSWGQRGGLWTLGPSERQSLPLPGFLGLFALGKDGAWVLAPADSHGRGQRLEVRSPDGRRSVLAHLDQIEAIAWHDDAIMAASGSAIYSIDMDGTVTMMADKVGRGLHGLTMGENGPIVAVYESRQVVELSGDGTRRVLLTSEAPWAPSDVTFHDGALYVVELAEHPCCWKGPRVRQLVAGQAPRTLVTIDDEDHIHLAPWERPLHWLVGSGVFVAACVSGVILAVRRRAKSPNRSASKR
jgi:hypothetical protein